MIPYPEDYNYMLTGISPDIIPLNPVNPEEKAIHLGGPGGAIWDSCWSNRGDGIAVIRSKYLYESTYSSSTLWVWKKDNNGKWQNGYEVTLDKTQVPVSLSW